MSPPIDQQTHPRTRHCCRCHRSDAIEPIECNRARPSDHDSTGGTHKHQGTPTAVIRCNRMHSISQHHVGRKTQRARLFPPHSTAQHTNTPDAQIRATAAGPNKHPLASRLRRMEAMPRTPRHVDNPGRTTPPCSPRYECGSFPQQPWSVVQHAVRPCGCGRARLGVTRIFRASPPPARHVQPLSRAPVCNTAALCFWRYDGGLGGKAHGLHATARAGALLFDLFEKK